MSEANFASSKRLNKYEKIMKFFFATESVKPEYVQRFNEF